jgi:iron complex outermembrane receptor protein
VNHHTMRLVLATAMLSGAAGIRAAQAENAEPPASTPQDIPSEIIVTAARRTSPLEDTALAVAALSGQRLTDSGITDTSFLQTSVPSLQFSNSGGANFIYLRGIGSSVYGAFSDNSVSTYVDGVYLPRQTAAVRELFDIDSVEVLRGPQATLYGRNATGGAILINTAKPTDEFTIGGQVQQGNLDWQRHSLTVSGPVSSGVNGRLSVIREAHDGFSTDLTDGSGTDVGKFWAARGSLEADPTDGLRVRLTAEYANDTGSMGTEKATDPNSFPFRSPPFGIGLPYSADPRASYKSLDEHNPQETYGASLHLSWQAPFATLTSTTAYNRDFLGPVYLDLADTLAPLLQFEGETSRTDFLYQDLLLASEAGSNRFEWLAGATALRERTRVHQPTLTPGGLNLADANTTVSSFAAYTQVGYALFPQLKLVGGVRFSSEKRDGEMTIAPPFGTGLPISNSKTWTDTSPKASLEFRPQPGTLLYLGATRGFKSGAFDPLNVKNVAAPEKIWSYELGLKQELLAERLQVNLTGFHYNYSNIQIFGGVVQNGFVDTVLQNAGRAHVDGLEFEPTFALTRALRLGASLALLNARYLSGTVLSDLANATTGPSGNTSLPTYDVGGNQMIQAPRVTASVYADLTFALNGAGWADLHADEFHQSTRYFTAFEDPTLKAGAYDVINIRAQWRLPDGHWTFGAFVRNAGNTLIRSYMSRTAPFGTLANYGAPRIYGADISFRF